MLNSVSTALIPYNPALKPEIDFIRSEVEKSETETCSSSVSPTVELNLKLIAEIFGKTFDIKESSLLGRTVSPDEANSLEEYFEVIAFQIPDISDAEVLSNAL